VSRYNDTRDDRSGSRLDRRRERKRSAFRSRLLLVAASIALIFSMTLIGLQVFLPRAKQSPAVPIVKDTESLEKQNETIKEQNKETQEEVGSLSIEMKEIKGEKVKVIETVKPALPERDNLLVQGLVMDFVRAQYAGDLKKLKDLSTPGFAKTIGSMPSEFLKGESGNVTFGSITSVAKEGEELLIFVRISDTKTSVDSEYQENFTVKKVDGKYLVDNMETDA